MIYGVNHPDKSSGNEEACEGRDIGLLQDTWEVDAWGAWGAQWRDVFVLDRDGVVVGVYNLTEHDLGEEANQAELVALFDEASGL